MSVHMNKTCAYDGVDVCTREQGIDNLLGLRSFGGHKRTRVDQLWTHATLRQPSLRP